MTSEKAYGLGEYRIIVYDDVLVRWERHVPLGMVRIGKGILFGDVLIIGKKHRDEDGFLIGEFLDELRKLPSWTGTRYHCFSGELLDVAGHGLTDEVLEHYASFFNRSSAASKTTVVKDPGTCRLGNYHITVTADGRISWRAFGEGNRVVGGPCSVTSGILVLGPQEHDNPGKNKKEFLDTLIHLQPWDRTTVWCRSSVLRLCSDLRPQEAAGINNKLHDTWQDRIDHNRPASLPTKHPEPAPAPEPKREPSRDFYRDLHKEFLQRFLLPGEDAVKSAWQRVRPWRAWLKWFVLLIAGVLLLGSAAAAYFAEKGFPWHHGHKKQHHDHHDE